MKIPKGGIAFFDSGIGGLTVLATCRQYLPNEIFYYYGDNQHAPYGNLPPKKIKRFVERAFAVFARLKVRAVVIACNTATMLCIDELRKRYTFPIIGTEPAVVPAVKGGGEVFVLTTRATFESNRFKQLCKRAQEKYPHANLTAIACDGLAGEIEKHLGEKDADFTPFLPRGQPDVVVLGCTHYIYIKEAIEKFYGCLVICGNEGVALRLCSVIQKEGIKTTFSLKREKNRETQPRLTTPPKKRGNIRQKGQKIPFTEEKKGEIFFLGKCQVVNKTQCEQMFAHNNHENGVSSGQKKQKN